jgi:hypothetical protein
MTRLHQIPFTLAHSLLFDAVSDYCDREANRGISVDRMLYYGTFGLPYQFLRRFMVSTQLSTSLSTVEPLTLGTGHQRSGTNVALACSIIVQHLVLACLTWADRDGFAALSTGGHSGSHLFAYRMYLHTRSRSRSSDDPTVFATYL